MIVARLTSKGQITIPKTVRDRLGVSTGDDVGFEEKEGVFVMAKVVGKSPFDKWVGKLGNLEGRSSDSIVRELREPGKH